MWGDVIVKVISNLHRTFDGLVRDGLYDDDCAHDQYAVRIAMERWARRPSPARLPARLPAAAHPRVVALRSAASFGLEEFRQRYNGQCAAPPPRLPRQPARAARAWPARGR